MMSRRPDFKSKSGGWVAWTNQDKNGNPYLNISIEGIGREVLFKVIEKEEEPIAVEEKIEEGTNN